VLFGVISVGRKSLGPWSDSEADSGQSPARRDQTMAKHRQLNIAPQPRISVDPTFHHASIFNRAMLKQRWLRKGTERGNLARSSDYLRRTTHRAATITKQVWSSQQCVYFVSQRTKGTSTILNRRCGGRMRSEHSFAEMKKGRRESKSVIHWTLSNPWRSRGLKEADNAWMRTVSRVGGREPAAIWLFRSTARARQFAFERRAFHAPAVPTPVPARSPRRRENPRRIR
jgi:hypothetical protein